jgi:hypothetical protein
MSALSALFFAFIAALVLVALRLSRMKKLKPSDVALPARLSPKARQVSPLVSRATAQQHRLPLMSYPGPLQYQKFAEQLISTPTPAARVSAPGPLRVASGVISPRQSVRHVSRRLLFNPQPIARPAFIAAPTASRLEITHPLIKQEPSVVTPASTPGITERIESPDTIEPRILLLFSCISNYFQLSTPRNRPNPTRIF